MLDIVLILLGEILSWSLMGVKRLKIEVSRVSLLIFCSDWMVSLSKAENNTGGKMHVSSLF